MLNNESILNRIKDNYGSEILLSEDNFGTLIIELKVEKIHEIISWLNRDEVLECSYLTLIGGVHYPDEKGREFAVVYHLHSWTNNFRLRLKVFLPGANPSIRSIVDIYNGANWMERETYDFFGINFEGHPDLRRILNMDSMDYFPMRKEYELEDGTREDKDDRFFGR